MRNYLITGANGYIGKRVLSELCKEEGIRLFCPIRAKSFAKTSEELSLKYPSVTFFSSDLNDIELMEKVSDIEFEGIVHIAGLYDLDGKKGDLYLSNVVATMGLCRFCNLKKISRFLHISTVAVAGKDPSILKEDKIERTPEFYNEYERTKFLAEDFVTHSLHEKCQYTILRPGIVLGSSSPECDIKLDGPYFIVRNIDRFSLVLKRMLFIMVPFNPCSVLPFTNVDMISLTICSWIKNVKKYEAFYNVVFSNNPKVVDFLKRVLGSFDIRAKIISVKHIKYLNRLLPFANIPRNLYDYLFYAPVIENEKFIQDFKSLGQDFDSYYDFFIENYKEKMKEGRHD